MNGVFWGVPVNVWTIIAAAVVTYGTRIGGHLVLSRFKRVPPRVDAALNAVPSCGSDHACCSGGGVQRFRGSADTCLLPGNRFADPDDGDVRHWLGADRGIEGCGAIRPWSREPLITSVRHLLGARVPQPTDHTTVKAALSLSQAIPAPDHPSEAATVPDGPLRDRC